MAVGQHAITAMDQQLTLGQFAQTALPLGIAVAVANQLVATRHQGRHQLRAVFIERGIDQCAGRQSEGVEQFQAAPGAYAVTVLAPSVIQHVGWR